MVTARTNSSGEIEMRAGGSGPTAIAQNKIKSTTAAAKISRFLSRGINRVGPKSIRGSSSNAAGVRLNRARAFEKAGIGRVQLSVARSVLFKFQPMRLSILSVCVASSISFAAQSEAVPKLHSCCPRDGSRRGRDLPPGVNFALQQFALYSHDHLPRPFLGCLGIIMNAVSPGFSRHVMSA